MGVSEIESSLRAFDCRSRIETPYPGHGRHRPTLREWFAQRSNAAGLYIVFITGHFLVVHKQMVIDNHKRLGLLFKHYRHQRSRVNMVWEIA